MKVFERRGGAWLFRNLHRPAIPVSHEFTLRRTQSWIPRNFSGFLRLPTETQASAGLRC